MNGTPPHKNSLNSLNSFIEKIKELYSIVLTGKNHTELGTFIIMKGFSPTVILLTAEVIQ